jgi:hypothetical protein
MLYAGTSCHLENSYGMAILHSAFVSSPTTIQFISKEMACLVFDAHSESSKHRPLT